MAFDLLYFDGHDLMETELTARRQLLEELVPAGGESHPAIRGDRGGRGHAPAHRLRAWT
nr:hypothetical protein [Rhizobium lentis]